MSRLSVFFIRIFSYLPFLVLNICAWKMNLINRIFLQYRKDIVQSNLAIVFPKKSANELEEPHHFSSAKD